MPLYFPQDIEAYDTGNILTVNCTRSCICIFYVCEKNEGVGVGRVSRGLVSKQFEDLTPDSCCSCCWQLGQTVCGVEGGGGGCSKDMQLPYCQRPSEIVLRAGAIQFEQFLN